jgi:hypothetical protein
VSAHARAGITERSKMAFAPNNVLEKRTMSAIVSGRGTPSVSGSVKMSRPARMAAAPKVRKGMRLELCTVPASAMKGATMPPTRAAWFAAPRTPGVVGMGGVEAGRGWGEQVRKEWSDWLAPCSSPWLHQEQRDPHHGMSNSARRGASRAASKRRRPRRRTGADDGREQLRGVYGCDGKGSGDAKLAHARQAHLRGAGGHKGARRARDAAEQRAAGHYVVATPAVCAGSGRGSALGLAPGGHELRGREGWGRRPAQTPWCKREGAARGVPSGPPPCRAAPMAQPVKR